MKYIASATLFLGKKGFINDNSMIFDVLTSSFVSLSFAGTQYEPKKTLLTAISEPFDFTYYWEVTDKTYTSECITVLSNDRPYIVLNTFQPI